MPRPTLGWTLIALLAGVSACGDGASALGPAAPDLAVIVSDAVARGAATASGLSASSAGLVAPDAIAYVSLAPGSVADADGDHATIRDLQSGAEVQVELVDGGFDPVGIVAAPGDTIELAVALPSGLLAAKAVVPAHRSPRVVRTSPARGRSDVPLNASIVMIFSEPLDPATLDTSTVHLLKDGVALAGVLRSLPGVTGAEFTPAAPLAPQSDYQLVLLAERLADPSGERLEGAATFEFATGAATFGIGMPQLVFTVQPFPRQFNSIASVVVTAQDGAGQTVTSFNGEVSLSVYSSAEDPVPPVPGPVAMAVNGVARFSEFTVLDPTSPSWVLASATGFRSASSQPFAFPTDLPSLWQLKGETPWPRFGSASAIVDGILYVVGGGACCGWDGMFALGTVQAFDPATGVWSTRAPMPTPRFGLAVGVVNGILYAVGGYDRSNVPVATVEAYDPATNTWTPRAPMPTARSSPGVGVVNGVLYAVGGVDRNGVGGNGTPDGRLATVEAYDPVTDTWSTRTPMPTRRGHPGVAVVDGVLYAVGGIAFTVQSSHVVEAYDPRTNTWSVRAPTPPWAFGSAATLGGRIYAVGLDRPSVASYDPATNVWQLASSLPSGRGEPEAVAVLNGVIYVVVMRDEFMPDGSWMTGGYVYAYEP
jgi:N-acetylneuraminic acid mutarotase